MKILFLIYSLGGGGAERVTTTLANEFAGLGHSVQVAVLDGTEPPHYPLDARVAVVDLGLAGTSRSSLQSAAQLIRRVFAIRRHLRSTGPDLAIGMMTTSAVLLALAGMRLNITRIGSERVFPPAYPLPRMWMELRRLSFQLLDAVVVQTDATRRWIETNTTARRVEVIANPVERAAPTKRGEELDDATTSARRIVLAAGRLVEQKGFGRLISSFAAIAEDNPCWDLVILGEGPLRACLEAQVSSMGLSDRIKMPGNVDDPGTWYDASEIFVLPSFFEGMPNALLEAMAHGLPCIAFDIESGTSEFVRDGVDGILIDEGATDGLSNAMNDLMRDGNRRLILGNGARHSIEAFAVERIAPLWLSLAAKSRN